MIYVHHMQSDGQTEVTNRTLGDMLHCLVMDNIKSWDSVLCKVEFAHNYAVNINPTHEHGQAVDLVANIYSLHTQVHDNLQLSSAKYKVSADRHRHDM
uniref:Uncharacterized protein n=1 Tax=Brassica oleracea var. oleracea TaxID=109376 RepID=A0A0D3D9G1_BRAOL